jgi:hypothetical protein
MTQKEIAELLRMNFALYKLGAKPLTDAELKSMCGVWYWHFRRYPAELVKTAFLRANAVCRFPVQPADIFDQMHDMAAALIPDPETQWQALKAAVRKASGLVIRRKCPMIVGVDASGRPVKDDGTRGLQELYDALPPGARDYLGGVSALVDLTRCSDDEIDTYRRTEFMQYYAHGRDTTDLAELAALPQYSGKPKEIAE